MEDGISRGFEGRDLRFYHFIPSLIAAALSRALTGLFALAGAFSGAMAGALAGRASESGVLRGAGLGAIAGAVLSVEVLEASRSYWCSHHSHSRTSSSSSSSMADFVEELLHGRFLDEQFPPSTLSAYHWQASIANVRLEEINDVRGEVQCRGLSGDSLKKLPYHVTSDDTNSSQSVCCTICLQDIEVGETARSLPKCCHMFHVTCVDKWLIRHGSCPICRRRV